MLAVAHRLSTLSGFDRIVVLRHGQIVEEARLWSCASTAGEFARLWRLQSEGFDQMPGATA